MAAKPAPADNCPAALLLPLELPPLPPPELPLSAVWLVPLTPDEGLVTLPVQTKPLPLTTPLFWISGKGQVKTEEED
jgi:hypothetical protein